MSAPSGVPPSVPQLLWTAVAAVVTGTLTFLQLNRESHSTHGNDAGALRPATSHQLPPPISDFTDRTEVTREVRRLLCGRSPPSVVTVISGRPGVGKTSLALHVAHQLTKNYRDGQLYVNLRGAEPELSKPALVLADFLRALGVAGSAIPEGEAARGRLYRDRLAGRRLLIVLDNAAPPQPSPAAPTRDVLVRRAHH